MKHTPGPWQQGQTINLRRYILTKDNAIIAKVETKGDVGMNANLNLIASAPEMLEALNTLKFELAKLHGDEFKAWVAAGKPTDNTTTLNMLSMLVGKCTQVIHKATGEK